MAITISLRRKTEDADDSLLLFPEAGGDDSAWTASEEGRLAVDVAESEDEIVIRSAIAGVRPEDLEVSLHNDMLTIRGSRAAEPLPDARMLVQECHWGAFSRSIILPSETDADRIGAAIKDGVLTVCLPKVRRSRRIGVRDLN
jgi:HSP20 family protein